MRNKQLFRRWWWLAGAALMLAGWLLFWYLPRPLTKVAWPISEPKTRYGFEDREFDVRLDSKTLEEVLEGCQVRPAFRGDYLPYQTNTAPCSVRFLDGRGSPWELVAGPDWMVFNSGGGIVWPVVNSGEWWPELLHCVLSSGGTEIEPSPQP